jgi:NADPH:quinone reductase-like Zn-dependent oxidoreductase
MKAIVHSRYGPPDALEFKDIDQPVITDDQVLVQVHAAAVGKGDWLTVKGLPYVARLRYGLQPKAPRSGLRRGRPRCGGRQQGDPTATG